MPRTIKKLLLETLEELVEDEVKRFKWHLAEGVLEGFPHIPKSQLEKADRQDTVDKMVKTYGYERAVDISLEILRKMNQNDLVEKLQRDRESAIVTLQRTTTTMSMSCFQKLFGCASSNGEKMKLKMRSTKKRKVMPRRCDRAILT
ncbi:hypothetical protein DPEC_G00330250 [Dallia pectoralis]|uniref:Uncharacterized protein n=1 Tax=Dallia pectoralis TaxID=75939 RepID=A0ACC2F8Y8_DALPE|nr:hypothetical protein DPEC_G00330250 [Dallia pectoralis]